MSYNQRPYRGRGGRRGGHRDRDDHEERRVETPEQRLKGAILRFGEVDVVEELPRLVKQIREQSGSLSGIVDGISYGATQQPYKTPYYANLLRALYDPDDSIEGATIGTPLGRTILEDLWKAFQAYLDKLAWRELRLLIHLFAHLTNASIISADSMLALLEAFTAVLEEFGVSHTRAKRAASCAFDGLLIAGKTLKTFSPSRTINVIESAQTYVDSTAAVKWMVHPAVTPSTETTSSFVHAREILDVSLTALRSADASDFESGAFPQPYALQDAIDPTTVFDLPNVLVPPEVIELETENLTGEGDGSAHIKKEEWPEWQLNLFDSPMTADPSTPAGLVVKRTILDIVDIFEVNRKECARLLLEYPKWAPPGTFQPKQGAPASDSDEVDDTPKLNLHLENTIIETILGALFVLPQPSHKSVYYITLITELCKLSPASVGPAVGKSIRRLYSFLADGLDVEVSRRFAEWFAVHMSNFGFQWVWKEWIPDMTLAPEHPKRAFIRRALEFEIRLSYHERILKTLPESMQTDPNVIPQDGPSADYKYDHPASPYYEAAQSILNLLRGRAKAEDVIAHLDTVKSMIEGAETEDGTNVDSAVRAIVTQSLLHIGSRSFSHLLNAIERYLPVLRTITSSSSGSNIEAKMDVLSATASFWKFNNQMVVIVFDKLMQYQMVDTPDVIGWVFLHQSEKAGLKAYGWDLLKAALDKANGRVMIAKRKVTLLRKEDDERRARTKATNSVSMEVDAEMKTDTTSAEDNPALLSAMKALTSLTREQKATLSRALEGFVSALVPISSDTRASPCTRSVLTQEAWDRRTDWGADEWSAWETWGWYQHFCRTFSAYLRSYSQTLFAISLSRLEDPTDPAAERLKRIWNVALGQDS